MVMRVLLAVSALVMAGVHFFLWWAAGYDQIGVGQAFLANGIAGIVIAVLLVTVRHWVPLLLAIGLGVVTLAAFFISMLPMGLFGVHDSLSGGPQWTAFISELVLVFGADWALRGEGWVRGRHKDL